MTADQMTGKVVLVTGGANGLGRASAIRLATSGAQAMLVGDLNEAAAAETADELGRYGCDAAAFPLDVTIEQQCEALAEHAMSRWGRIDVLVAAAGVSGEMARRALGDEFEPGNWRQPLTETATALWQGVLDVNLNGLMYTNRAVARHMVEAGTHGSIVNITSMCSSYTSAGNASYTVSKAAAWMLTKCLALELAPHQIRVNAVGPGFINTAMTSSTRADAVGAATVIERTPLGRFGEPIEVANAVLFLASQESSFFTGEILYADGGFNAQSR